MEKMMKEAVYDFINQKNVLARQVSQNETQPKEWLLSYMQTLDTLYQKMGKLSPVFALLKPGPEHGLMEKSYQALKKSGFEIQEEHYNLVYIKPINAFTDTYQTVLAEHRALLEQPSKYPAEMGDVVVCGNRADDLQAFFIDEGRYLRVGHFITAKLSAALTAGCTIQQEYALLNELKAYEVTANRRQYLKEWFPELSQNETLLQNKKNVQVSHCETVGSRDEGRLHPGWYSEEEVSIANHTNIVDLVRSLGYTTKRIGKYVTLEQMDSIRIYSSTGYTSYSRFSDGSGGTAIDFLMNIERRSFREAVKQLLDFNHYTGGPVQYQQHRSQEVSQIETEKKLLLPTKSKTYKSLYAYLIRTRGFEKETVDYFVKEGLIYEADQYHNVVFLGKDSKGVVRHAFQRGTLSTSTQPFKRDVAGSNKRYGFNVNEPDCTVLAVFEAAIDLMSFWEVSKGGCNMLALGGTADPPLETYLEEHPWINCIGLMLDNDEAGSIATKKIIEKFTTGKWKDKQLSITDSRFDDQYKDWNERMIGYKADKEEQKKQEPISPEQPENTIEPVQRRAM